MILLPRVAAAAGLALGLAVPAAALPIGSVSTNDTSLTYSLQDDALAEGATAFSGSSSETWQNVPSFLIGADYVRTGQGDNSNSDLDVTVDFDADGTLYVFHSDQISDPSWLSNDFALSADDLDLAGATSGTYSIYSRSVSSGSNYTLLANDPATGNTGLMYGIAAVGAGNGEGGGGGQGGGTVIPLPGAAALFGTALAGLGALGARRRRSA